MNIGRKKLISKSKRHCQIASGDFKTSKFSPAAGQAVARGFQWKPYFGE